MEFLAAGGVTEAVENWIAAGGYVVLFGLLFLCGLGLPVPEDIPLIIGGALVARGNMNIVFASVAAWCGIIGGDIVLYHLGRKFGLEITRVPFVGKHLTKARIERAETFFERYGVWVVAVGRMFAGIRGAMVVAAGATRFNFWKFIIADGLAALVSGGLFVALGYWLGANLESLLKAVDEAKHWFLIGSILAGLVAFLWFYRRHKRRKLLPETRHAGEAGPIAHPEAAVIDTNAASPPLETERRAV
jgi:membrane protein DedA with SNARE-associated domain